MLEFLNGHASLLEWVNGGVCLALLAYLLPVATVASRWTHRLSTIALAFAVGLQVMDPFARWVPTISWTGVLFNICLLLGVTAWRHELWAVVRFRFNDEPRHPRRRVTDMLGTQ
jgi:hypothetical protein